MDKMAKKQLETQLEFDFMKKEKVPFQFRLGCLFDITTITAAGCAVGKIFSDNAYSSDSPYLSAIGGFIVGSGAYLYLRMLSQILTEVSYKNGK
jgi:hypothetical protein